ncbi:hypothetical protein [Microbispora sp. GKU 823]|uniref:hypothetical protein n=1 Tax=Microbispora sp. GKU 823 TaxID=1652100 RepID=UPI0009A43B4B|nr:hypothetical protein [Microbispora sp. GKU 823]OPG10583.1 hypothetical protein B1L11_23275 [Microbispora sp. GKU 823]
MAMYRQDYPGLPEMVEIAAQHARAVLSAWGPAQAETAEQIVRALAEDALTRTAPESLFTLTTCINPTEVSFEVCDPGVLVDGRGPTSALAEVSRLADTCGTRRGRDGSGHVSWAGLRLPLDLDGQEQALAAKGGQA